MDGTSARPRDWPGEYPEGWHALQLLREALERHGCADVHELAARLGVGFGPMLLPALGYPGDAKAAWAEFHVLYQQGLDQLARKGTPA